jgi:hypothetical protein
MFIQSMMVGGSLTYWSLNISRLSPKIRRRIKYFVEQRIIQSSSNVPNFSSLLSILPN